MEDKKSGLGVAILVFVFLLAGLVAGYYVSDSNMLGKKETTKKEEMTKTKEEKQVNKCSVEVLDVTDPIVSETMSKMNVLSCDEFPYRYLLGKNGFKVSDFTNADAMRLLEDLSVSFASDSSTVKKDADGNEYKEYSEKEILDMIQAILGKDYKFEHKNYGSFKYDKENKKYKVMMHPWGCTVGPHAPSLVKVTKAVIENGLLTITYKIVFGSEIPMEYDTPENNQPKYYAKYYKDIDLKNQIPQSEIRFSPAEDNVYMADDTYSKNYNLGSTYKFTFEDEDGNYVFVSSELVK